MGNIQDRPTMADVGYLPVRRQLFKEEGGSKVSMDQVRAALEKLEELGGRDVKPLIGELAIKARNKDMARSYQLAIVMTCGSTGIKGIEFHPDYPFLTPFKLGPPQMFTKEAYGFLFYMLDCHKLCFSFNLLELRDVLDRCYRQDPTCVHMFEFFYLLGSPYEWQMEVDKLIPEHAGKQHIWGLVILGRNFSSNLYVRGSTVVTREWIAFSSTDFYDDYKEDQEAYKGFKARMLIENGMDPEQNQHLVNAPVFERASFPAAYLEKFDHAAFTYAERLTFGYIGPPAAPWHHGYASDSDESD